MSEPSQPIRSADPLESTFSGVKSDVIRELGVVTSQRDLQMIIPSEACAEICRFNFREGRLFTILEQSRLW